MNSNFDHREHIKVKYPNSAFGLYKGKANKTMSPEHLGKERNCSNFLTAGSIIFYSISSSQLSKFSNFSFGSRCDS